MFASAWPVLVLMVRPFDGAFEAMLVALSYLLLFDHRPDVCVRVWFRQTFCRVF